SAATAANLLFLLRISPLVFALTASLGLALPAFFEFEPRATNEGVGMRLWVLSLLGLSVLGAMIIRGVRIVRATVDFERTWLAKSTAIYRATRAQIPVYSVLDGSSLLAVSGVLRPRVFVSREIAQTLSRDELSAAIAHEVGHVTSFDNLRQFLLKITRPPRWLNACGVHQA